MENAVEALLLNPVDHVTELLPFVKVTVLMSLVEFVNRTEYAPDTPVQFAVSVAEVELDVTVPDHAKPETVTKFIEIACKEDEDTLTFQFL